MRPTSIGAAVEQAARIAQRGEDARFTIPHYDIQAVQTHTATGGWVLTLRHYGTPILNVSGDRAGPIDSSIDPAWWGSRTDMSAIGKAHRALGMRRHIKAGRLVAY